MSEELLNVLELEQDLKSRKTSRFIKDKKNLSKICAIIVYEISCIVSGSIPYIVIVNLIIPLILKRLYKDWQHLDKITAIIVDEIRKTSDYRKCIELYSEYIKNLAEYISKYKFENIKETAFYFDFLLSNGVLSSNLKNTYHDFEYDRNYIVEILGARALSGASVCRHMSCLAADCFNELGYVAELFNVASTSDISKITGAESLKEVKWAHGVVAIEDNSKKFLYDPTVSRFSGKASIESSEIFDYIAKVSFVTPETFLLINPTQYSFSKSHNGLKTLTNLPLEKLNEDELFFLRQHIYEIFDKNRDDAYRFYCENYTLVNEIANLESSLCPHSDKEITSWTLKK